MRPQRAYLEHILQCIARIAEDSRHGKEAFFQSHTLQDAILRNLQVMAESTQRPEADRKQRHPEIDWRSVAGLRAVHSLLGELAESQ